MLLFAWSAAALATPNVLVVIADDLGVDKLTTYQADVPGYAPVAGDMPVTPMIDALAANGVRFTTTWSNPLCTPTRAGIMTGRHAFRTGVGHVVGPGDRTTPELRDEEVTLAEKLGPVWSTGMFGKWDTGHTAIDASGDEVHLDWWTTPGTRDAVPDPNRQGFEVYDGGLGAVIPSYWSWRRTVARDHGTLDGQPFAEVFDTTTYATEEVAARALDFALDAPEPWLAVLAFNSAHIDDDDWAPEHAEQGCSTITSASTDREAYRAMVECVDRHLEVVLGGLETAGILDDTVVLFVSDNGTKREVGDPGFPQHATGKGSPFESGVRVPLVVAEGKHLAGTPYDTTFTGVPWAAGDLVKPGRTSTDLVQTIDLHDTVLELAQLPPDGEDSISFAAELAGPSPSARRVMYSELFEDEDLDGLFEGYVLARASRYKLVVEQEDAGSATPCQQTRLYDLVADRGETDDLASDPAYAGIVGRMRGGIDGMVRAHEAGGESHWLWTLADGPTICP